MRFRPFPAVLGLMVLPACLPPPPVGGDDSALPPIAAPALPMDPGQITCAQVTGHPATADAALDWVLGQRRAALIAGTAGPVPDVATARAGLMAHCAANPGAAIRTVPPLL